MKWGIDGGNYNVKVCNKNGVYHFLSCLGEWRQRNLSSQFGDDDMEWEYEGAKGFAGTLAKYESEFLRERMGSSKAHDDALLRILLAIHRYGGKETVHDLVVGQPIINHTQEEKQRIKEMLKQQHTIKVNGVSKTFWIRNVEVAAEGGAAYWSTKVHAPVIRLIDVGSGTVNLATIDNGRFIDRDSTTLKFGVESTKTKDISLMADSIIASTAGKWEQDDVVLIAGGIADEVQPFIQKHYKQTDVIKPIIEASGEITFAHPMYANAVGFYHIARGLYEKSND